MAQPSRDSVSEQARPSRRLVAGICLGLALWIAAIYSGVSDADFITLDDSNHVYANSVVTGGLTVANVKSAFTEPHASLWVPLSLCSFMLDVSLFGLNPQAMHLENVAWHAGAAIFLFLALRRATDRLWPSACVAALFALHPINVESVAWVTERKNVLCAFFSMLALWCWVGWTQTRRRACYAGALLSFVAALLAKPMAVTLPCVLMLLDFWPLRRLNRQSWRRLVVEKLPLLVIAFAVSRTAMWAAGSAVASLQEVSGEARVTNALVSYAAYLRQLIWPTDFAVYYQHNVVPAWTPAILAAALLAGLTWLAWRERQRRPWILTGWLMFLGMLVPTAGLVQVGSQGRADRFTYLAQIGLFITIVWTFAELPINRWPRWRPMLATAVIVTLSILTNRVVGFWTNSVTLYERALAVTGPNVAILDYLAVAHKLYGQPQKAADYWRQAVKILPNDAQRWNDLGCTLAELDRPADAIVAFSNAVALDPSRAECHFRLALLLETSGKLDAASQHAALAVKLDPNHRLFAALDIRLNHRPPPPL